MGFKGKAIYQSTGKAAEYSPWACNFYTGCSNGCEYCYCKRGVLSHTWSTEPKLKKGLIDGFNAIEVFKKELWSNIDEIRKTGLLFSFTTDPLLPETRFLTFQAAEIALSNKVPVKILTKRVDWLNSEYFEKMINPYRPQNIWKTRKRLVSFGFTLTGVDEQEPGASSNQERIEAMRKLHELGFKTFASIEPVLKIESSYAMINMISGWCDLILVGLLSGKKEYDKDGVSFLYEMIKKDTRGSKFYLKNSFIDFIGLDRSKLSGNFVTADYNIFDQHE